MTAVQAIRDRLGRWLDDTAEAVVSGAASVSSSRAVHLTEQEGGGFAVAPEAAAKALGAEGGRIAFTDGRFGTTDAATLRGARIALVLRPERFVFKPLELPGRASEFLAGIVRAQIDRLTPWPAEQAVFGFTPPQETGGGRIAVTVAATARAMVTPYVQALTAVGARSVTVSVSPPEPGAAAITVLDQKIAGMDATRVRGILLALLLVTGLATAAVVGTTTFMGDSLQARQDDLARQIAQRRAAMIAARTATLDPAQAAERALARRKNETPSTVLVIEALSQLLPDHTHVTELRIEGDRLRITGVSRDVPSLIRLIEQSRHFDRATFYAPTTRAPSDPGDRFNIEARIMPVFAVRS